MGWSRMMMMQMQMQMQIDDHGDHVFSVKVYFVELYFWGGVSWAQTSSPQRLNMATASSEL